jgi:competence protein ComER
MNTGFIGIGSMGGMLVRAFLRSGALAPEDIWVANRSQAKLDTLAARYPGIHIATNKEVAAQCDLLFLCLSAADAAAVLTQMVSEISARLLLLTTASATPLRELEDRVPCRVAKLIPSVTQEIGAGIALLIYGSRVTTTDRSLLENLLGRISRPVVIAESLAHPAIALASGGPALLAYVLQSMVEEALRSNPELSADLARQLVQETSAATMKLLTEANMTPEEIIRRVAVPGGRTALALEVLSRYMPQAWRSVFRETAPK